MPGRSLFSIWEEVLVFECISSVERDLGGGQEIQMRRKNLRLRYSLRSWDFYRFFLFS